ncbi:transcriptional regulator, TetR family [Melghirimyces thermohalophilus]|uniref:Transcriptional regulator, TetR family n=1 Tax=Melghirimyces thermohalophilus TaxID=1236220 RepID=A0A1G6K7B0_9BACL|nr:TetR/AcrR family transcriptional regulator [Melghirimyces thermohalophilus]SDC26485.1 transcriptional regulator, TetR family [Melghirimyces thermohalophilus]
MPLQRYEKERILDACLTVFARHGYEKTSTAMLAEAAGISKALIFHHYKSKKKLYLSILDRCVENLKTALRIDDLIQYEDFFAAKEQIGLIKVDYLKRNPDVYKVWIEAFLTTPEEVKAEIEQKYGELLAERDQFWRQLFDKVPLREGVDREAAYRLVQMTLDGLSQKYVSMMTDDKSLDFHLHLLDERKQFLDMIRYGIEGQREKG